MLKVDKATQFPAAAHRDSHTESSMGITELFGKDNLEIIMRKISAVTGLAFMAVDYRGDPATDRIAFSSFCQKIQVDPERKRLCDASCALGAIQAAAFQKTHIYFCPCGFLEVAVPIVVRGQYLGGFVGGQVRCVDAPPDIVQLKTVLPHGVDYTKEPFFREDYEKMQQMSYEKFVHVAELIRLIVDQMCEKEMFHLLRTKSQNDQRVLHQEKQQRMEVERELNESKLVALRSQMYHHFIMSTLTAISNLAAVENASQTNEVITSLAKFLYDTLHGDINTEFIDNEMQAIERYLYVQKTRLGEELEYTVHVPEDMYLQRVPSMMVFPFVERAVYYGIVRKQGGGKISVTAEYDKDDVVIRVADDGPGLKEKEINALNAHGRDKDNHGYISIDIGVKMARQRLIEDFGGEYDVKITTTKGQGTVCAIRYPRAFDEGIV